MDNELKNELFELLEELLEKVKLVDVYIENNDSISDTAHKSVDRLLTAVYVTIKNIEETVKYS